MCQFISFFHKPTSGEIAVKDLTSHGNTEKELDLNLRVWREGHYLPNGEVILRLDDNDRVDPIEYKNSFSSRFPTFNGFLSWVLQETNQMGVYKGDISLDGLTSAEGLVLPKSVGGGIFLDGLTSAKGLVLPKSVGGYIYLNALTSAEGLIVSEEIKRKIRTNVKI